MVIVMVTLIMQMAIITGEGDRSPGKTICADRVISRTISGLIVKKKMVMMKHHNKNSLKFKPADLAFSAVYETF